MRNGVVCALIASVLFAAAAAFGQTPEGEGSALRVELRRLREEFDQIRQQYTERLNALELRLTALDQSRREIPPPSPPQPPAPGAIPSGTDSPTGALPVHGNVTGLSKIFNPDLAVIGNFVGAHLTFPTRPGGLLGKAGKFRSAIGRVNTMQTCR
jgi:hypothetical protein